MNEGFDMLEYSKQQAEVHARLVQTGMSIAEDKFHTRIRSLEAAYFQACLDPETKIPSYLMAVMISMFGMLPERYADAMVKRDQLTRLEGSNTQHRSGGYGGNEMDARGGTLVPGR